MPVHGLITLPWLAVEKRRAGMTRAVHCTNCTGGASSSSCQQETAHIKRARALFAAAVPLMSKNCKQTPLTDFKVSDVWESDSGKVGVAAAAVLLEAWPSVQEVYCGVHLYM